MKYCIIGKGFIFDRHKQAIKKTGGKILATCDIDEKKKADYIDSFDLFSSRECSECDAVVILTPNYLHAPMAREAIRRGKRVLVEKPLAIDSNLSRLEDVNTVLQLRYHPSLKAIKQELERTNEIQVNVKLMMYRDKSYFKGWKGNKEKSGGLLYNLGIHYLDMIVYLFGDKYKIEETTITNTYAYLKFKIGKAKVDFRLEILERADMKSYQTRTFEIMTNWENGFELKKYIKIDFSDKDNLSYEDLHTKVYKDFIKGEGVSLGDAKKSLLLVNDLLKFNA